MRSIKILTLLYVIAVFLSICWAWRVNLDTSNWLALIGVWVFGAIFMFEIFNWIVKDREQKVEHSKKLVDEGLRQWFKTEESESMFRLTYHGLAFVEDTVVGKVVYSERVFKAIQPSDPKLIKARIWKDCKQHLMSREHLPCWQLWESSKNLSKMCNENVLTLLERIKSDVSELLKKEKFSLQKWDGYHPEPSQYYVLDNIASAIYQEIRERLEGRTTAHLFPINELSGFFRLEPTLAGSTKKDDIELLLQILAPIRNDEAFKRETLKIKELKEQIKLKVERFSEQLESIVESVELGKPLKGKCDDCP
jgi:hypothetical protein